MRLSPEASEKAVALVRAAAGAGETRKVLGLALRSLAGITASDRGSVFVYQRSRGSLHHVVSLRSGEVWDPSLLMDFFLNLKPELAPEVVMAPVRVGPVVTGVMALGTRREFAPGAGKTATEILRLVGLELAHRRRLDLRGAGRRLGLAALRGVRPADLTYRVFHELRRFIDYEHGATLLGRVDDSRALILARQKLWEEGKSTVVGKELDFPWEDIPEGPTMIGPESGSGVGRALAEAREADSPGRGSILVSPLGTGAGRGLVEISSARPGFFLDRDLRDLREFTPYLAWCLERRLPANGGDI
jgi:hypothetical protein